MSSKNNHTKGYLSQPGSKTYPSSPFLDEELFADAELVESENLITPLETFPSESPFLNSFESKANKVQELFDMQHEEGFDEEYGEEEAFSGFMGEEQEFNEYEDDEELYDEQFDQLDEGLYDEEIDGEIEEEAISPELATDELGELENEELDEEVMEEELEAEEFDELDEELYGEALDEEIEEPETVSFPEDVKFEAEALDEEDEGESLDAEDYLLPDSVVSTPGTIEVIAEAWTDDDTILQEQEEKVSKILYRPLKITRTEPISTALRKIGYKLGQRFWQHWLVLLWIRCGMTHVKRKAKRFRVTNPKYKVKAGDTLFIRRKRSADCIKKYKALVSNPNNFRDYYFPAPLRSLADIFILNADKAFQLRPQTVRLNTRFGSNTYNLKNLIRSLSTSAKIAHPVRDLYVISHFHPIGNLWFPLTKNDYTSSNALQFNSTDWLDLKDAVTSKIISIPKLVARPRPKSGGSELPFHVHVRGCALGTRPQYVGKLREALGNTAVITAPKHWNGYYEITNKGTTVGYAELMAYDLAVFTPIRVPNRRMLKKTFIKAKLKNIHGQTITRKTWGKWTKLAWQSMVDNNVNLRNARFATKLPFKKVSLEPAVELDIPLTIQFQAQRFALFGNPATDFISKPIPKPKNAAEKKKKYKSYVAEINAQLKDTDDFKISNPFPWWKRLGFNSMQDFMDGFYWELSWPSDYKMQFKAIRYRYAFLVPITEGKRLFMNFYHQAKTAPPHIGLSEDDDRFFYRTPN